MKHRKRESGQTLLELVIALGVVAVVITALVSAVTASLRYSQATRFRSRAVKFAQEGVELTRKVRDEQPWSTFFAYTGGDGRWCLDASGVWTDDDGNGTCPLAAGDNFWRSVHFSWDDTEDIMIVTVRVSWGDRSTPSTVELVTHFTEWK
mgnify:CR=1 FL=1|jgi:Tfp pilus assembly protein PilV